MFKMKRIIIYFTGLILLIILLLFFIHNCLKEHYITRIDNIPDEIESVLDNLNITYHKGSMIEYKSNFDGFYVAIEDYKEYHMFDVIRNPEYTNEQQLNKILNEYFFKKIFLKYKIIIGLLCISFIVYIMIPMIYIIKNLKKKIRKGLRKRIKKRLLN